MIVMFYDQQQQQWCISFIGYSNEISRRRGGTWHIALTDITLKVISRMLIVSPFQRRKSLSETLERPLRAENRVFLKSTQRK